MFSVFLDVIKRIGIFIIVSQAILHFGIGRKYETYMKLVVSFMVIAQIIFSFGIYLGKEEKTVFFVSEEEYYEQWNENLKRMEENFKNKQKDMEYELKENSLHEGEKTEEKNPDRRIQIEKIVIQ